MKKTVIVKHVGHKKKTTKKGRPKQKQKKIIQKAKAAKAWKAKNASIRKIVKKLSGY
jgi:hypothetical protein